ncbi:MAG: heavy-metal-associated domain-containing protein [Burkholderiaceae bacterium]|nr:heavy-metal-associated domain-containing protein [Burkholderiaceae bacterium]
MIAFEVKDMTCGHCVGVIRQALEAADPGARLSIDLAGQRVTIEPAQADANALSAAIAEAGYTPRPVETAATMRAPSAATCCGQCH